MGEEQARLVTPRTRLQRLALAVVMVVIALVASGAAFIWSGVYDIAANRDHWASTEWLIATLRDQSIAADARGKQVPDISDPGLIALGAQHYLGACADCHGTPGEPIGPVYQNMLPQPADLTHAADRYTPAELYTIIYNGLKYTGMPAWPASGRSDEAWAAVAFVVALQAQGPQFYRDMLATLPPRAANQAGIAPSGLENCIRCHGDGQSDPIDALVPRLNGQPAPYLRRALEEYRAGTRPSGIMGPLAHPLTDAQIATLADFYAGTPSAITGMAGQADLEVGSAVFLQGVPAADVPACASCHINADAQFPRLEGQSAAYLARQLHLWRQGLRDQTGHGAIMAPIARRLTPAQIEAVSSYLASLPAPQPSGEAAP